MQDQYTCIYYVSQQGAPATVVVIQSSTYHTRLDLELELEALLGCGGALKARAGRGEAGPGLRQRRRRERRELGGERGPLGADVGE